MPSVVAALMKALPEPEDKRYQPVAEVVARPSRPCFHRQDAGATLRRGTFTTGCYTRARSCMSSVPRANSGFRAVLYRLKAKIDIAPIAEEEVRAAGWDRSDYARP